VETWSSVSVRYLDREVNVFILHRIKAIAWCIAASFEVEIDFVILIVFDVLVNTESLVEAYADVAREIVGNEQVYLKDEPVMGSEDFADMLHAVPGVYCTIGHEGSVPVHNPGFVLDDGILPVGASLLARIVEKRLATAL